MTSNLSINERHLSCWPTLCSRCRIFPFLIFWPPLSWLAVGSLLSLRTCCLSLFPRLLSSSCRLSFSGLLCSYQGSTICPSWLNFSFLRFSILFPEVHLKWRDRVSMEAHSGPSRPKDRRSWNTPFNWAQTQYRRREESSNNHRYFVSCLCQVISIRI